MGQLDNKVAMVTGAAHSIGKAIALGMAREGADIAIGDIDLEAMAEVEKEIQALGVQALAVPTDVTDEKQILNLFDKVMEKYGHLDILVNNAGIFRGSPIDELSTEAWDAVISTNLRAHFLCTRSAFRIMKEQGGGRIINIGSISAKRVRAFTANYNAAKAGLVGLTHSTALEGRDYGINCGIIHPGVVMHDRPFTPSPGLRPGPPPEPEPAMTTDEIAAAAVYMACMPDHVNVLELVQLNRQQKYLGRG